MTEDWPEGELRQAILCDTCGREEVMKTQVPEEWRGDVEALITSRPSYYWTIIRDRAFQRGWVALPVQGKTVDVCPSCTLRLRAMAMMGVLDP